MSDYSKYIWFNSKIIPWKEANTHVMSHVLHYEKHSIKDLRDKLFKLNIPTRY